MIGLFLFASSASFGQNPIDLVKEEARDAKLSPELFSLQQKEIGPKSKNLRQAATPDDGVPGLTRGSNVQMRDGLIAIEAISNAVDGSQLLSALQSMGLQQARYYKRIVFGYFPVDKLDQLKSVSTLHIARPAYAAFKNVGKTTSQGDSVMRADKARTKYNVSGAGSKVGVISDSYNSLNGAADGVASGDLPTNVQVIRDIPATIKGTDEGRAMAEIVHDVAPGAGIAFNTGYETQIDFALGILDLAAAGCNIIVDDLTYFAEPFFQDGILAQVVDYVSKELNVSYFSSAGNNARQSYTSGFRNSGKTPPSIPAFMVEGQAHDFVGNGTIFQKVTIAPGGQFFPIFQWADPFYSQSVLAGGVSGAKTDLDILVYYNGILQPQLSSYDNNIDDDPIEAVQINNTSKSPVTIEIALVKYAGPDPMLIKWVDFGFNTTVQFSTQSSTAYGHSNAQEVMAVGATAWFQTPAFSPSRYPLPLIETFSSAGGTPILFTEYGQPFPTRIRKKPDFVAPDGGNTTFFGQQLNDGDTFPNFFGTSAAAPHAAAVAALLQERSQNKMSPNDVRNRLSTTAIDMDDPSTPGFDVGFDFRTGYGFIQVDKALMFGEPLVLLEPLYDCQTRKLTVRTSGGDGTPITFLIPGVIRTSPTSTTGIIEAGLARDPKPITIQAMQNGVTVYFTFDFAEYCTRPKELTLLEPLFDCVTGKLTVRTVGGDGTTITYQIPGVKRSAPTDAVGYVEPGLLSDPKTLTITAQQSGVTVKYLFNFAAYCSGRARVATTEPGIQVSVFGNPVSTDWAEVEVRGAQGQPLKLRVNNTLGELMGTKAIEQAGAVEHHKVSLGHSPGLYFLQVITPTETKTIKLLRQ